MADECEDPRLYEPLSTVSFVGPLTFQQFINLLGGIFMIISCLLSFRQMHQHATNYTKPHEQRHIIRILFMVPMYSIAAWISIDHYKQHVYLQGAYEFYEAIALAAFFILLCTYLDPSRRDLKRSFDSVEIKPWFFLKPFSCCFDKRHLAPSTGVKWFNIIWLYVFQLCLVKLLATIAAYITEHFGVYCGDSSSTHYAHFWLNTIQMISLIFAMHCLVQFYLQCRQALKPHKPVLKFLAIKIVIGILFLQNIILNTALQDLGSDTMSYPTITIGVPNAILCAEMVGIAVLHIFAYPVLPYTGTYSSSGDSSSMVPMTHMNTSDEEILAESRGQDSQRQGPLVSRGGKLGWRAYVEALNMWDIAQSVGKGLHWAFIRRHQQNKERKNSTTSGEGDVALT